MKNPVEPNKGPVEIGLQAVRYQPYRWIPKPVLYDMDLKAHVLPPLPSVQGRSQLALPGWLEAVVARLDKGARKEARGGRA